MKYRSLCLAAACALALPMTASADFLINSFEGASLGSPVQVNPNTGELTSHGFATAGVTDGTASYAVTPNHTGASFLLKIDVLSNPGILTALMANPTIEFDITIPVDADPADAHGGLGTVHIVNSLAGGFDDSAPGSYYNEFVPYDGTTITGSFDVTPAQIAALSDVTNTYAEITLGLNIQSGEAFPTAYFDNIRVVPEPATMALLGLGGLAILRRR